jgi:hypothetical protein
MNDDALNIEYFTMDDELLTFLCPMIPSVH